MVTISMRKLKEILRLKYGCHLSHRQIAKSLSISPSVVSNYSQRATRLGIHTWPLPEHWTDTELQHAFQKTKIIPRQCHIPDWSVIYQELQSKTMTMQLLWEEYMQRYPKEHYSYTHFCRQYKQWLKRQRPVMRQQHKAGEKLFVDYCGPTLKVMDTSTGNYRTAQVFVAVMGASNYTYAEATWSQNLEDWIMSHARCFEFLGGVPELVVPDNLKSGVSKSCRYEPDINPTYQQLAAHFNTVIVPARPYKPKDKAKAEVAVQIVERWIMARLRHEAFFSLKQLNMRIMELLKDMNNRPLKKQTGTRQSQFDSLDKPVLKALPVHPYQYMRIQPVRVQLDYHVEVDKHYYSVPHALIKQKLEAHITRHSVTFHHRGVAVATHQISRLLGQHSTKPEHMPPHHRHQKLWTIQEFENWSQTIGAHTFQFTKEIIKQNRHPEQSYRASLGLKELTLLYEEPQIEAACKRAIGLGIQKISGLKAILKNGVENLPVSTSHTDVLSSLKHNNVRGNHYYN